MNSVFSEQILADKLSKLNSTQQCIETLSHWCIFHRSKAELVVATWDKQFHSSDIAQKVPLLYLANDILQNSKRKGNEFVTEFWKVLPSALKEVANKGDDRGKNVVSRLVGIWEERRVFGSHAQSLKDAMLGEELPPPLEFKKKRSRSVRIVKKDSRSIRTKLSIGGTAEKIVSAFHSVLSEQTNEDEEMSKCKSAVHRVKKLEKDVDAALTKAKDPSRKTLAKELEEEENTLKQCIDKLKVVETNRVVLLSELRDALHEQESELENLRTQIQVAQAQVEEATNMRIRLDEDHVFESKPSCTSTDASAKQEQTSKKSAAAIAAEVADKLAASSSSQYIMTSVLSTFAAEEAKNAGLTTSSTSTTSFSLSFNSPMSKSENLRPISDPNVFMPPQLTPPQNNPYQSIVVPQPSIPGQISSSQAHYHSIPNPTSLQYMQPSGGIAGSYDYGSLPPLPPGPPPPAPPSFMVSPMVPLMQQPLTMGHQQSTLAQQQSIPISQPPPGPAGFRPLAPMQAPGMVYYTHPYQSQ
ncbi:regulation of nuclear pre-mRNA domain-containing protein 1B [Sesamum indicum]|uniref:Regulation of nuclear pre-mRNA domain-containing protein 1B n=1 Tax=Sesamum indicum TaxID=4182 RepID=A0A6I9UGI7_SESIN|nr:regulation of nuclear pre-mRNA domain-containing protein 1B [Sesamum indicum]